MGRLTESLRAEIKRMVPAKVANLRMQHEKIRRFAGFAATPDLQLRRILEIIREEDLPESLLARDHGDLSEIPDQALRAYVRMLAEAEMRNAGEVPSDETAAMLCVHCGPVWTNPGVAACLPLVDGWPRACGCPWCHVERDGKYVPRPLVACGECKHFIRDSVNPFGGMGKCGIELQTDHMWPGVKRTCAGFRPEAVEGP